ncbi:MAG: hypothetical protein NWF03_02700 [Candidatus Bathyarchaeota archaeon]|nr:hypothetical protein [Candidatus Bathyarchaeota archaeon]
MTELNQSLQGKNPTKNHQQTSQTSSYNTIGMVHNKFSSLVSSKTVYSLRYIPKNKQV